MQIETFSTQIDDVTSKNRLPNGLKNGSNGRSQCDSNCESDRVRSNQLKADFHHRGLELRSSDSAEDAHHPNPATLGIACVKKGIDIHATDTYATVWINPEAASSI